MKRILLSSVAILAALTASAQAYTYFPYKGTAATPITTTYSIPDAAITSLSVLNGSYTLGVDGRNYDQVDAGLAVFSGATGDYDKTCGYNTGAGTETTLTAVTNIRTYTFTFGEVNSSAVTPPNLAPFIYNGTPATMRKGGGWYNYTVNVTSAGDYSLAMRVRAALPDLTNNVWTVTVYKHSDMTVVDELVFNLNGITDYAVANQMSTDTKMKTLFMAKGTTTAQANSAWVLSATADFNFPSTGLYVVKVSHGGTTASTALGSFAFIEKSIATSISKAANNNASLVFDGKNIQASVVGTATLKVYDLSGRQVATYAVDGSINQDLGLKAGVYVVALSGADVNKTVKVVVK